VVEEAIFERAVVTAVAEQRIDLQQELHITDSLVNQLAQASRFDLVRQRRYSRKTLSAMSLTGSYTVCEC
jgi:hypothetical protein